MGQRKSKYINGTFVSTYLPDPSGQVMLEFEPAQSNWRWMFRLNGQPVGMLRSGQVYLIHPDHLGRPEAVTALNGAVVWRVQNEAFDRTVTSDTFGGLNLGSFSHDLFRHRAVARASARPPARSASCSRPPSAAAP